MTSRLSGPRWLLASAGAALFLAACGDAPSGLRETALAPAAKPSLGQGVPFINGVECTSQATCVGLVSNDVVVKETLKVCKWYPAGTVAPPAVTVVLDVVETAASSAASPGSPNHLEITLQPNQCKIIWLNGEQRGPDADQITLSENVPAGYVGSSKITTIVRIGPRATGPGQESVYDTTRLAATSATTVTGIVGGPQVPGMLVEFTNTPLGTVGDRVYNDLNGNGTQDLGEPGMPGVALTLNGGATTTTDATGAYSFGSLPLGPQSVTVTPPAGFVAATPTRTTTLTVSAPSDLNVDFGLRATASIGDRVWSDTDGDGVEDAGEPGIVGATVTLSNGVTTTTTTTGANGAYGFANLPPGTYTVCVSAGVPAGSTASADADGIATPGCAVVVLAGSRSDIDFGYAPARHAIGGTVWNDVDGNAANNGESGIAGVTVTVNGGSPVTTSATGAYSITNLLAGTYTICTTTGIPAGYTQTYDRDGLGSPNCANVTVGPSVTDADFGYTPPRFSIGDRVWDDVDGDGVQDAGEPGLNGATVTLTNLATAATTTATTAGDGNYDFGNLLAGSYTICVGAGVPAGYTATYDADGTATPGCTNVTVGPGSTTTDFGFKAPARYTIGGIVWNDVDANAVKNGTEPGLDGVTVTLNGASPTTTSGGGTYGFANLLAGTYTVCVTAGVPAGYTLTTPATSCASVTVGPNGTANFGYTPPRYSISGLVWNDVDRSATQNGTETGLGGVGVTLNGGSAQSTSGTGAYTFANLLAGTYTICTTTGIPAGYTQTYDRDGLATPNCASVTVGPTVSDANFGYGPIPVVLGSIGDFVWNDLNKNGVQDAGEPGLAGLTVTLAKSGTTLTTTTNASGLYAFTGVTAGTWTLTTTVPSGYVASPVNAGGDPAKDSNGNGASVVVTGATNNTVDIGLYLQAGKACTYTQGYWKNHEESWPAPYSPAAQWMTPQKKVAGLTWDGLFGTSVKGGNSYVSLAHQWMAAKLNQTQGAPVSASVLTALNSAEAWLLANTPTNGALPSIKNAQADAWASTLDDFNNGKLGPSHCD